MDDAAAMSRVDGFGNLRGDAQHPIDRQRARDEDVRKGRTVHELEDQRHRRARLFNAVDGADVRMVERREHFRFAMETRQAVRVAGDLRAEALQGDVTMKPGVPSSIHHPHATRAQRGQHLIGAERRSRADRGQNSFTSTSVPAWTASTAAAISM